MYNKIISYLSYNGEKYVSFKQFQRNTSNVVKASSRVCFQVVQNQGKHRLKERKIMSCNFHFVYKNMLRDKTVYHLVPFEL